MTTIARNRQTGNAVRRVAAAGTAILFTHVLVVSGCGYMVGGTHVAEVSTVHVPTFTSDSFRRGVELQLTEAVQRQIQDSSPYRLAKPPYADTRLVGRILSIDKRVENQNRYDDPRELEFAVAVEVVWEDARTGQTLASREIPIDGQLAVHLLAQPRFAPETGQSLATATQDAVDQLAAQIVGMMETPW